MICIGRAAVSECLTLRVGTARAPLSRPTGVGTGVVAKTHRTNHMTNKECCRMAPGTAVRREDYTCSSTNQLLSKIIMCILGATKGER